MQTALAFRTWRLSDSNRLLSINAPNLTGKAGGSQQQGTRKIGWIHRHLADEEGQHGCSCGIYATTEIKVINSYLGNEMYMGVAIRGPVLGIVEMGGKVIPATQGYRARFARVAAILAIPSEFSLTRAHLAQIAELYQVPLLEDISKDPEDYREAINQMPVITNPSSIADEMEQWLAIETGETGEADKKDEGEGGE